MHGWRYKELSKPKPVNGTSSIFNGIYSLFDTKVVEPNPFHLYPLLFWCMVSFTLFVFWNWLFFINDIISNV